MKSPNVATAVFIITGYHYNIIIIHVAIVVTTLTLHNLCINQGYYSTHNIYWTNKLTILLLVGLSPPQVITQRACPWGKAISSTIRCRKSTYWLLSFTHKNNAQIWRSMHHSELHKYHSCVEKVKNLASYMYYTCTYHTHCHTETTSTTIILLCTR